MIKKLLLFLLPSLMCATTTYVSQSGGVFSGGTACNGHTAVSVATFNGNTPAAGDIIWICGTITSQVFEGSDGASGNPITINFDTGAKISMAVCNGAQGTMCLNIGNWVVVNGGVVCGPGTACSGSDGTGIVEATANGSGLANTLCGSAGVQSRGGHDLIENLVIRNIFKRVNSSDATPCGAGDAQGFFSNGSGNTVQDSTLHMVGSAIYGDSDPQTDWSVIRCYIYDYNWGFHQGVGTGSTNTNYQLHDNHFGSPAVWDDTGGNNHHNGIFLSNNSAGAGSFSGMYIYNNLFDGDPGAATTARIYFGGGQEKNVYVWNNVFNSGGQPHGETNALLELTGEVAQTVWVYNNTLIGSAGNTPTCVQLQGTSVFTNNAVTGCNTLVELQTGTYVGGNPTVTQMDHNVYGVANTSDVFQAYDNSFKTTIAAWRTYLNTTFSGTFEANSTYTQAGIALNTDGSPQGTSPVISAAVNLTSTTPGCGSTNLSTLCSDTSNGGTRSPVARSGSGAWDSGAFQFASGGVSSAPTVTTTAASSIAITTASAGGNVTSDGGASVTSRGTCYSTISNPTVPCSSDGSGTGVFTSSLSGLLAGTMYHIRAYATNSVGTSYGSDLTFITNSVTVPVLSTTAASSITSSTASSGGNVTSDGGAAVTARGVCYSTSASPTSPCTSNGTGTGSFTGSLSGLAASTTFHIRAFATNSIGTSYGSDLTFTTSAPATCPCKISTRKAVR